jgi:hypothetical protein
MNYIPLALTTAATVLLSAATLNYYVDPAGIYSADTGSADRYAALLVESENGIWWPEGSISERPLKLALAKRARGIDCAVIGSSHVMQISSHRPRRSLASQCQILLNLSVSGASIEDHITLAYTAINAGQPAKIVLGIDPWVFAFGKTQGWWEYRQEFYYARKVVLGRSPAAFPETRSTPAGKIANLISLEYTLRSLLKISREAQRDGAAAITPATKIDDAFGGEYPVILPDGSLIYSAASIAKNHESRMPPVGNWLYQTDGELIQPFAVDSYKSLILWIREQGVEPVLLMTPYHETVWESPDAPTTKALLAVEPIIRDIGRQLHVRVIGSFDPVSVGCKSHEFSDYQHARLDCLMRLGQK